MPCLIHELAKIKYICALLKSKIRKMQGCYALLIAGLLAVSYPAHSFTNSTDSLPDIRNRDYVYHAKKMKDAVKIDGIIDEPDWMSAQRATDFHLVLPVDTGKPVQPSDIMLTYDDKAFYMAIIFYDTIPGKRIAESFRRDFLFMNNDNFLSFFDTFLDQTNGFSFGVNAAGAVWDGMMYEGATMNLDWDIKWDSKTKQYPDRWITEMRIPFKSVRYPRNSKQWLVNFSRLDLKSNEKSSWAPVPRQFPTASLAYTGILDFEKPLPKPKPNISVIPYIFGSYLKESETAIGEKYRKDFGFDAKIGLSSALNLDLTYNPDFAQVEVDRQQMNVDRFELYYPEKRQFFLENRDLFSGFGYPGVTPFFSRRIGLDAPVLAGARLSGKVGNNLRIGLMNMTTEKTSEFLSRNFTVATIQKKVFSRSNVGFIFINKEYLNQPDSISLFNRVAGMDFNLASRNNFWTGKVFYHRSFQPGNPGKQFAQGATTGYKTKSINLKFSQTSVGENYLAETGFVRRKGYNFLSPEFSYTFVPNKKIVSHGPVARFDNYYDPSYSLLDHEWEMGYQMELSNRSLLKAVMRDNYVLLSDDFDPTHASTVYLPKGSDYRFRYGLVSYASDNRKILKGSLTAAKGEFYNGNMNYLEGMLTYRYQPYMSLTMNFTYTDLMLPDPFTRKKFWLFAPTVDFTFTNNIFFSTFVQYNEQMDNLNLNMRFQWRYQPVSDLFIVYTDNYIPGSWNNRNRALVVKLTYWLN
jgi:hypothetical protein